MHEKSNKIAKKKIIVTYFQINIKSKFILNSLLDFYMHFFYIITLLFMHRLKYLLATSLLNESGKRTNTMMKMKCREIFYITI